VNTPEYVAPRNQRVGAPPETAYDVPCVTLHGNEGCTNGRAANCAVDNVKALAGGIKRYILLQERGSGNR
jgi:hypothetical protein